MRNPTDLRKQGETPVDIPAEMIVPEGVQSPPVREKHPTKPKQKGQNNKVTPTKVTTRSDKRAGK